MKLLYLIFIFSIALIISQSRAEIAFNIGGTGSDFGTDVAADTKGNFVATGYFQGTVDFDPSDLKNEKTAAGNASDPLSYDIYVAKYDSTGKLMWVFTIGSTGADMPRSVYVDDFNYIYITGYFSGQADFDPTNGSRLLNAGQGRNAFLAKYTPDGKLEWAISFGDNEPAPYADNDPRFDEGFDIAVNPDGLVYVTGAFSGKIDMDASDPEDPEDTYTSVNGPDNKPSRDIFVACYDTTGSYLWGFALGGPGLDEGHAIRPDMSFVSSVFVAGMFSATADFDPHDGTSSLVSAGSTDAFLVKFDILQNLDWAVRWGSTGPDQAQTLEDYFDQYLFVGGSFSGTVDFDPAAGTKDITSNGGTDCFITTFDLDRNLNSAFGFGGPGDDGITRLSVDILGDYYATGWFRGTADFDPSPNGTHNLTANSTAQSSDAFLAKFGSENDFLWAYNFGSNQADASKPQSASGLTLDKNDNPIITGVFTGTANFATGGDTYTLTSNGLTDAFVSKYDPDGLLWSFTNPDEITVTSPNGGETWEINTQHEIKWQSNFDDAVKIEYSTNGGVNWTEVAASVAGNSLTYNWIVPNTPSAQSKIKITKINDTEVFDESDAVFTIKGSAPNPSVVLVYPNGKETFHKDEVVTILWTSSDVQNVKIDFSKDDGQTWKSIVASTPAAAGAYQWTVPDIGVAMSEFAIISISDESNPAIFDLSDQKFTIINTTPVDDNDNNAGLSISQVYPGPASAVMTVGFNLPTAGEITLEIINTAGSTVSTIATGFMDEGAHSSTITVNGLESGVYFLRLSQGGTMTTRKIVVVK